MHTTSTPLPRLPARWESAWTPSGAGTGQAGSSTERDSANRRLVPASEVARLRGVEGEQMSARNHFRGVVREVKIEGLLAQVELDVTEPARVVAIITRDAAEELGLTSGMPASAVVKATSVMVELRA